MHSRKLALSIAAVCCLLVLSMNSFAGNEPAGKTAVGTWKLDLSKSSFGNVPAPRFEQMVISRDDPSAVKWSLTSATADGKTHVESYDGPVDGKEHKMTGMQGASSVAYTRTANAGLQWVIKDANGKVVEAGAGQLSPDGRTLTLKGTMEGPHGKSNFTAIYNRAQ